MITQLLKEFEESIEELALVPSSGGVFEIEVDGEVVHSKQSTGAFPEYEDVAGLLRRR